MKTALKSEKNQNKFSSSKEPEVRLNTDYLRQLDKFIIHIKKRVSTVYAGNRRSTRAGRGIDTIGYREYYPGDDIRDIDWKAYSRTEKMYVRQFEEEKTLTAHVLVDISKSMDFKTGNVSKLEYAGMIAVGISYIISRNNDKYAISTFDEKLNITPVRRGSSGILKSIDYLSNIKPEGKTDIDAVTYEYVKMIKSRSLVVIISDFLESADRIENAVRRFSENDLILIQIEDPIEANLDISGDARFFDMETGEEYKTYVSNTFRKNYIKEIELHKKNIERICYRYGAEFYSFVTDAPVFESLLSVIEKK